MRLFVVSLGLLFIALVVPSYAEKTAAQAQAEVVVREGEPLRVECLLRVEQRVEWRVEGGGAPAPELRAAEAPPAAAGGGVRAVLAAPAARLHHAGVYTCARDAPAVRVLVLPAAARARAGLAHAPHGVEASTMPASGAAAAASVTMPPAAAAAAAAAAEDDDTYTPYRYEVGYAIVLNCSNSDSPPGIIYTWTKNKTDIEAIEGLKGRYEKLEEGAVLRVKQRTNENDFGDYKCIVGGETAGAWRVQGVPSARMTANVNVVEGQKLKLTCKLIGKPYPPVQWLYAVSDSGNETKEPVEARLKGRFSVLDDTDTGVPNGVLLVEGAERSDAGNYTCAPPGGSAAHTVVRVKGMYDALWPFLGICAEVFILCAIILVYEKRRTKPELDDSDTDNHDQKKS